MNAAENDPTPATDPPQALEGTDAPTSPEASDVVPADSAGEAFRLGYVPGATPAKWARVWNERLPDVALRLVAVPAGEVTGALRAGDLDAALLRLPVDKAEMSAIALYAEVPVVVMSTDHALAALEEDESVLLADLDDEILLDPLDAVLAWADTDTDTGSERDGVTVDAPSGVDVPVRPGLPAAERPATTADAVELVAAGIGVIVVPKSLARLHHRKDVTFREVPDGPLAPVGLGWVTDRTTDLVQELVGIVRGRTANSSRGPRAQAAAEARAAEGDTPRKAAKAAKAAKTAKGAKTPVGGPGGRSSAAKRAAQGKAQYRVDGGPRPAGKGKAGGKKSGKGGAPRRGR